MQTVYGLATVSDVIAHPRCKNAKCNRLVPDTGNGNTKYCSSKCKQQAAYWRKYAKV
jgi:hypothetical protein